MRKILIIEDDKGISSSLKLYLENSNFDVFLHHEGYKAIDVILDVNPDLIILDINLPGKNGIDITREYRLLGNIPIIMLTARSGELDRINGLEIGADDYIAKPFSPRELLARINTIIRRIPENKESTIIIDESELIKLQNIEININKKTVKKGNNVISLTGNEYDILKKLFEENGKVVSREYIMKEIIGYDNYLYDRTIDTHIKNLRKKLDAKDLILTIRGEGYRINI
ncbi:MAG: response regulator transcription factor [Candidatus Gracilibacteria bacterium]|nr:response regulator transcription factor [Candidatus Gracilibacteria bacterium]